MIEPDQNRLVADLQEMVARQSVNPFDGPAEPGRREQEFAEDLQQKMNALGLETDRREVAVGRPNVWGRLKGRGDGPAFMLAAHTDTVGVAGYDNPFDPHHQDGRVYGRGSCDMKAAIACYFEVVRIVLENAIVLEGDLVLCFLCDEEHGMIGSADAGRNGPHADFGIIGEPTELKICPSHKGEVCLSFVAHGKAAHSSIPENGINAVEMMGAVISTFSGYNAELMANPDPHPLCGTGRFSMNVIRGGDVVSGIPERCELEVDRRYLPGEDVGRIIADYDRRLDALKKDLPFLDYSISTPTLDVKPLDIAVDSPLVETLTAAAREVLGREPDIAAFPGGTDAPNLGFPCVICGPGSIEQAHTTNEFVEVRQMVQATSIYLTAIRKLIGAKQG